MSLVQQIVAECATQGLAIGARGAKFWKFVACVALTMMVKPFPDAVGECWKKHYN